MNKYINKLKFWFRGKHISPTLEEIFDHEKEPEDKFEQSLIPKVLTIIGRFLSAYWMWLIGTLIATAFLGVTILQYIRD